MRNKKDITAMKHMVMEVMAMEIDELGTLKDMLKLNNRLMVENTAITAELKKAIKRAEQNIADYTNDIKELNESLNESKPELMEAIIYRNGKIIVRVQQRENQSR